MYLFNGNKITIPVLHVGVFKFLLILQDQCLRYVQCLELNTVLTGDKGHKICYTLNQTESAIYTFIFLMVIMDLTFMQNFRKNFCTSDKFVTKLCISCKNRIWEKRTKPYCSTFNLLFHLENSVCVIYHCLSVTEELTANISLQ